MRTVALALLVVLASSTVAVADERRRGVVVLASEVSAAAAIDALGGAAGVQWTAERLVAEVTPRATISRDALGQARAAYVEADFPACLARLATDGLDVPTALERGDREAAAAIGVLAAACALGAGEDEQARESLRAVLTAELEPGPALEATTNDVRRLAAQVRAAIAGARDVRVTLRSRPTGARVVVDGGAHECARTPCTVELSPGDHVFAAELLGRARVVRRERVAGDVLEIALPRASATEARAQVAAALAEEQRLDRIEVMQVAALGFETDLVVLAWQVGPRAQAVLYDEQRDQVASRTVSARGGPSRALPMALRQVALDWAGNGGAGGGLPTWGWTLAGIGAGLVIAGTAILTWVLVDAPEEEPRYELVYGR